MSGAGDGDGTLQVMSQVVGTNSYNVTQSMKCNVGICFNNLTHSGRGEG